MNSFSRGGLLSSFVVVVALTGSLPLACGSSDSTKNAAESEYPGAGGEGGGDGAGGSPTSGDAGASSNAGAGGADGAAEVFTLPFTPSNVDVTALDVDPSLLGDVVIEDEGCVANTDLLTLDCVEQGYQFFEVEQEQGSNLVVLVTRNFTVEASASLLVEGAQPLVVIAQHELTVRGLILATALGGDAVAGGGAGPESFMKGGGVGAGGAAVLSKSGGGGGSYCGKGGSGAVTTGAGPAAGTAYGTEELIPLLGGAPGGSNFYCGGAGGGAVQLVAGDGIDIQSSGGVSAGGGGGCGHEGQGGGGGSGGAILLEAPVVTVTGTLSANGGSGAMGSGGTNGSSGQPGSDPAAGAGESGGDGSGGADEAGSAGTVVETSDFGGGGGGAGRIRINTTAGEAEVAPALLSPSPATECVTQGTLAD